MATDSRNWFYRDFARTAPVQGPFTLSELAERAQTGELAYDALVRCGDGEWLQADRVNELIDALRQRRVPDNEPDTDPDTTPAYAPPPRQATPVNRRRLNWIALFFISAILYVIAGILVVVGFADVSTSPLAPLGHLVALFASVIFLCAIIRWAIEPLFAQMVDTNNHLARISKLLKKADERKE